VPSQQGEGMNEYEIRYPDWRRCEVRDWWRHRELFLFLAWRDIKVKYKQTAVGLGWVILQPLALMMLFTLFWKRVVHVETAVPYPVFVYSGIILWELFSSGVSNASTSMIEQGNVIKKVYYPRIIVPTSAMLVSLFDFVITFCCYAGLLVCYGVRLDIARFLLFSAAGLLLVVISMLGSGLFLAAINIRYRDARYALPFLLRMLFFATPVIFPLSVVKSDVLAFIISLNPVAAAIYLSRAGLSSHAIEWPFALPGFCASLLILLVGLFVFNKNEIGCADIL
jgi:lipopolysaccharide transport system permease protein